MGVRIFQLAKELGMSSKELMTFLKTQGHKVTNHMCALEDNVAQILRDRLPPKKATADAAEAKDAGEEATGTSTTKEGESKGSADKTNENRKEGGRKGKKSAKTFEPEEIIRGARTATPGGKTQGKRTTTRFFPEKGNGRGGKGGGKGGKAAGRGRPQAKGGVTATQEPPQPQRPTEATIQLPINLKDLSAAIGVKVNDIIKALFAKGMMLNVNSYLEEETLLEIGAEFEVDINFQQEKRLEDAVQAIESFESSDQELIERAPVVTFMGHVDHGKTSLLDYIRQTRVVTKEHGGITQHLGAYKVDDDKTKIVFIDTPGHKAFTEMRARGANITDVAVLIVAADEGPMPQTEEAYNHIKAAEVPIIVALNKIDKPNANLDKTKDGLAKMGLMAPDWGGTTEMVGVSAQTGEGIDNLLETIGLEAELLELRANPARSAVGVVLEAESNTGRGNLATILIQDGTLRLGDHILCGAASGRVRNMWLNGLDAVDEAGPSTPVQISGLNELPEVGDKFYVFDSAQKAREIAEERQHKKREEDRASVQKVSLQNFFEQLEKSEVTELNLILKADVKGTLEAIKKSLEDCGNDEVQVRLLHGGVGPISQDDILLADASNGIIMGFNVTIDDKSSSIAIEKQVEVRIYNVIYEIIDDVKRALEDRLTPDYFEEVQGHAEILQVFKASKIGNIAGCMVRKGSIFRDSKVRVYRDDELRFEGSLASLKRIRDDVKEVKEGFECGIKVQGYNDIQRGDKIEAYTIVEKKRSLE